jgi:aspartate aminotransferase
VVVTSGAVNALYETLRVLTDPGDAVLLPEPGWPNYAMMAAMLHVRGVGYPTPTLCGSEPDLDRLEGLLRTTEGVKVLLLNTPNNPTGAVYSRTTVERIVELCQRYDVYLLSDECYDRIVFAGEHVAPATIDGTGRVLTVRSVSKTYAMTGWRVGFVIAGDRSLADLVAKAQEPVTSCAAAVSQKAAEAALLGDQTAADEMVRAYHRRRDVAVEVLGAAGVLASPPNGAFYAWVQLPDEVVDSSDFARRALTEHAVAVAPGETFGPAGRSKVRISLAAAEHEVKEGAQRLVSAIQGAR